MTVERAKLRVGTRRSRLARIQAGIVVRKLRASFPGLEVEECLIRTAGDAAFGSPPGAADGKGLFTREIEEQLVRGRIDLAVHSYKDLPTELPRGCVIGAVLEREPPEDVLVAPAGMTLLSLPRGARVGTSSVRRAAQVLHLRRDLAPVGIRGNVDTRLAKLDRGGVDALILARAGLARLGCEDRIAQVLGADCWYYAAGQGALAVEVRRADSGTLRLVQALDHAPTRLATDAERALLRALRCGCRAPVGVRCTITAESIRLAGMVAAPGGMPYLSAEIESPLVGAARIGRELAAILVAGGASRIINQVRAGRA